MTAQQIDPLEAAWNKALGTILKRARNAMGLSMPQLAGLVDRTARSIKAYEDGTRRPDARMFLRLTHVLHIDLTELPQIALAWGRQDKRTQDRRQLRLPETD